MNQAKFRQQRRAGQVRGSRTWLFGALLTTVIGGAAATALVLDRPPAPTVPTDGAATASAATTDGSSAEPSVTPDPNIAFIPNSAPGMAPPVPPAPPQAAPADPGANLQVPASGATSEGSTAPPRGHGKGIIWESSFDAAMAKSKSEGKPVMVDFYTTWCSACKFLDANVYTNRAVIAESRNWINVRVDAEKRQDLATVYGVTGYPTLEFVRSDGHPVDSLPGAMDTPNFLQFVKAAYAKWSAPTAA